MHEPDARPAILSAHSLTRRYGTGPRATMALDGVSLAIPEGGSVGIVGESGAGKSTLLRMLLGLETPDSGEVRLRDQLVTRRNRALMRSLRREVQVVFQDPRSSLDPRMTVGSSIAEPLRAQRLPGPHRARVAELLSAVGLEPGMAARHPTEFSGGQRQRIAIARALAPRPSVLIADEPVSALDVTVRRGILALLRQLRSETGMALVMVSHDMAVVGQLCDDVVVMRGGHVIEAGPTAELFTNPRQTYTRELLAAVPQLPQARG